MYVLSCRAVFAQSNVLPCVHGQIKLLRLDIFMNLSLRIPKRPSEHPSWRGGGGGCLGFVSASLIGGWEYGGVSETWIGLAVKVKSDGVGG